MAPRAKITRSDFAQFAQEKGLRAHSTLFSLTAYPRKAGKAATFACVVSKSVAKMAHDRNRIRRLCRESVNRRLKEESFPYSFVFRAKKESKDATFKQVDADIQFLFKKLSAQRSISTQ